MKIILFEYFLKKLIEWFCELHKTDFESFNNHPQNDFSKIKVIKLHFFACSTTSEALDIYNDFRAMPYGHVESDVYRSITSLKYVNINNSKLEIIDLEKFLNINEEKSAVIDTAISKLKLHNENIITLTPFELVELSHKWFSWRINFEQAKINGSYSKPISINLIKQEAKIYQIN